MNIVHEIIEAHPETISPLVGISQMRYILNNLYSVKDIPGDVVELACNIGTTALYIRRLLDKLQSDKVYHVYDSFEGLPEPAEVDGDLCKKGDMKREQTEFIESFISADLVCPIIHKGWFAEIPDSEYPDKICFAFFDGDFFSSILDSFCKVYHKMSPGGIILVHDYEGAGLPGVKKACDYFLKDKPERVEDIFWGIAKFVKE